MGFGGILDGDGIDVELHMSFFSKGDLNNPSTRFISMGNHG